MKTMRIQAFLRESPMFRVTSAARRFSVLASRALEADKLSFLDGLILVGIFFEAPLPTKPSELAETFATTRGNISHSISSLEAKGLVRRTIDPADARAYLLALRPEGKRAAFRVISEFDQMQRSFEAEVGKAALAEALKVIRTLEHAADRELSGRKQSWRRLHDRADFAEGTATH